MYPFRMLAFIALFTGCQNAGPLNVVGASPIEAPLDGYRTTSPMMNLSAHQTRQVRIEVPIGAEYLDVEVAMLDGGVSLRVWDFGRDAAPACDGTTSCRIERPGAGTWMVEVTSGSAGAQGVELTWELGGLFEDIDLINTTIDGADCFTVQVPNALGTLVATGTTLNELTMVGGDCAVDADVWTCTRDFPEPGAITTCGVGAGQLQVAWSSADLVVDAAVDAGASESFAVEVPEGALRLVARGSGGAVSLHRGGFALCTGQTTCDISNPTSGTWTLTLDASSAGGSHRALASVVPEPPVCADDAYEPNDSVEEALALPMFLSWVDFTLSPGDRDVWEVSVEPRSMLTVDVEFRDVDVDAKLINFEGWTLDASSSFTDNEQVVYSNNSDDVERIYLEIRTQPSTEVCATYSISHVQTPLVCADNDAFEPNQEFSTAVVVANLDDLGSLDLLSVGGDRFDFYRSGRLEPGEQVVADLLFTDAEGDLDLTVYDGQQNTLASSASITDDEQVVWSNDTGVAVDLVFRVQRYGFDACDIAQPYVLSAVVQ